MHGGKPVVSQPAQPRHAVSVAHNGRPHQGTLFRLEAGRRTLGALQHVPKIDFERGCHPQHRVEAGVAHPAFDVAHHLLRKAAPFRDGIHRKAASYTLGPEDGSDFGSKGVEVSLCEHGPKLS